jgi:BirA family transcriptional regulator, biotin operon repressor / biotin---[acetyl-CoA-carboxylase] ligase
MSNSLPMPTQILRYPQQNFAAEIHYFTELDSTNTYLKAYARQALAQGQPIEGVSALANAQTAGRGRLARQWHSAAGLGCYFSLLLTPPLAANQVLLLTLMAAVAVVDALQNLVVLPYDIKWPNDILVNQHKLAGILTEASLEGETINYAVIGIGINLNHSEFPEELTNRATSLYLATGQQFDNEVVAKELLFWLDRYYSLLKIDPTAINAAWQQRSSYGYGKEVVLATDPPQRAYTLGLDPDGALRVKTTEGQEMAFHGNELLLTN